MKGSNEGECLQPSLSSPFFILSLKELILLNSCLNPNYILKLKALALWNIKVIFDVIRNYISLLYAGETFEPALEPSSTVPGLQDSDDCIPATSIKSSEETVRIEIKSKKTKGRNIRFLEKKVSN